MPEIGEIAPDFTLLDQDKEPLTLSDLRGAPVMLVFFPGAFSSTCTRELCEIRDDFGAYEHRGVTVLGISVDSTHALRAWQQAQGYRNRFLSDRWPVGTVAKLYGVWNEGRRTGGPGDVHPRRGGRRALRGAQSVEPGAGRARLRNRTRGDGRRRVACAWITRRGGRHGCATREPGPDPRPEPRARGMPTGT